MGLSNHELLSSSFCDTPSHDVSNDISWLNDCKHELAYLAKPAYRVEIRFSKSSNSAASLG
jgi:hypothetical protein